MPQTRGSCGHPKATWDNHPNCLSCSRCSVDNRRDICSQWSTTTWHCVIFRRTYSARSKMCKDSKDKKKKSGSRHRSIKSSSGVCSSEHRSSEHELPEGGGELDKSNSPTSEERRYAGNPPGDRSDRDSPGDRSDLSSGFGLEETQHKAPPSYRAIDNGGSNGDPAGSRSSRLLDLLLAVRQSHLLTGRPVRKILQGTRPGARLSRLLIQ